MKSLLIRFTQNESGATAIEYSLIALLIALAIITGASSVGTAINAKFSNISTRYTNYS